MENFLFFEDIKKYLKEGEELPQKPNVLDLNVQQSWQKKTNFKFRKAAATDGQNQMMNELKPVLFFNFKNIPLDLLNELDSIIGEDKVINAKPMGNDMYSFALMCKDYNMPRQKDTMVVNAALNFFKEKGYELPNINELMKNTTSQAEFAQVEQNANEKWMEMLQDIGSGKANAIVERYIQIFGKIFDYVHGHQLSFRNAKLILSQKPDATFVFTEDKWLKVFNCGVRPGAQRIIYMAKWSNLEQKSADDAQQYANAHGIDFNKNDKNYQGHAMYGMKLNASETWGGFAPAVGYDNSDVFPLDPNDDWRVTRYGMKNNLTGEPNDKTKEYMGGMEPKEGMEDSYNQIKELLNNNARLYLELLIKYLQKTNQTNLLGKYKIDPNNPETNYVDIFSKLLREVVDGMVEKEYKIVRDVNRAESVGRICAVVLYLCGVWNADSLKTLQGNVVTKETLIHDSNIINVIMELFAKGREHLQNKLKTMIMNLPGTEKKEEPNTMGLNEVKKELYEMQFMTPEKLARLLRLQVTDSEETPENNINTMVNENKTSFYEFTDRMNKAYKGF